MDVTDWVVGLFPSGGYFVEAGAHDGIGDSQTYVLEKLGWTGLCIEPSTWGIRLSINRPKSRVDMRVLGAVDGEEITFREVGGNAVELSGIVSHFGDHWDRETRPHKDRKVKTVSLTTMLQEHGAPSVIEFLSLDTEGSELAILSAHDFARFRFLAIQVEHNGVGDKRDRLRELLTHNDYLDVGDDGVNARYVHRSVVEERS